MCWAAAAAIAGALVFDLEPNMVEEGLQLHFAERLANGEHLYSDLVFFAGPLSFELLGLLFKVFGSEIMVARWAALLLHAGGTALAFVFARASVGSQRAHLVAAVLVASVGLLFPFYTMYFYTLLVVHLGLAAAYCAMRGLESPAWAFASGAFVAGVGLSKQSLGFILACSMLLALLRLNPRPTRSALAWLAGAGLITLVAVLLFVGFGDFQAAFHQVIEVPLTLPSSFRTRYLDLWPPGHLSGDSFCATPIYFPRGLFLETGIMTAIGPGMIVATQLLYALPFVALGATLVVGLRRPLPAGIWLHGTLALMLATNSFPRASWGHLAFCLPIAINQLVLLFGPRRRAMVVTLCVLAIGLGGAESLRMRSLSVDSRWGDRVPLRPISADLRGSTHPRLIKYVRSRVPVGAPIFIPRSEPLLYFATETTNPTPYGGVLQVMHAEQQQAILASISKIDLVIMSDLDGLHWTYYSDELPEVQSYLERHFELASDFKRVPGQSLLILTRRADRGETEIDLVDAPSKFFTYSATGERVEFDEKTPRLDTRHNRRPLGIPLGPGGGGVEFELTMPPDAQFEGSLGFGGLFSECDLHGHPTGVRALVSVTEDDKSERVFGVRFGSALREGWTPVQIDLSRFGGRHVTLRLEFIPYRPRTSADTVSNLAWWGSPRLLREQ